MDPTLVLVLGVLWFLVNLLTGAKKRIPPPDVTAEDPEPSDRPSVPDATQREGSRLETMLRQFERTLQEAEISATRRESRVPLPDDEDVEERQSLEQEPEIISLEQEVRRAPRKEFTQDEGAESLVEKRITAAASRDRARGKADHIEFDRKIRQEPAEHTVTRAYTTKQLQDAIVWREILGPPVSER